MEEATGIADAVRTDLASLKGRVAVVQAEQVCFIKKNKRISLIINRGTWQMLCALT